DAAASLCIALTLAASASGSIAPSYQRVACARPPRSCASSRTVRADSIREPAAALARVLATTIFACSTASAGRSSKRTAARKRLSVSVRDEPSGCCDSPIAGKTPSADAVAKVLLRNCRRVKRARAVSALAHLFSFGMDGVQFRDPRQPVNEERDLRAHDLRASAKSVAAPWPVQTADIGMPD